MRVTDLDKFSLEEIWRPYQTLAGYDEQRLTKAPASLTETAGALCHDNEWSRHVVGRLKDIGVTFPEYISHPLATVVKWRIEQVKRGRPAD